MQKSEIAFQIEKRITGIEAELAELRRLVQELDSGSKKQKHICDFCAEPINKFTALPCGCSVHKRCLNVKDFEGKVVLSAVCIVCSAPLPDELRQSIIQNKENLQKARQAKKGISKVPQKTLNEPFPTKKKSPSKNQKRGVSHTPFPLGPESPRYNR